MCLNSLLELLSIHSTFPDLTVEMVTRQEDPSGEWLPGHIEYPFFGIPGNNRGADLYKNRIDSSESQGEGDVGIYVR